MKRRVVQMSKDPSDQIIDGGEADKPNSVGDNPWNKLAGARRT